jgi:flagellar M-ring protein FliF
MSLVTSAKDFFSTWSSMSPSKKIGTAAIGASIVAALVFLGTWVGEKTYVPLYSNLQPENSIELVKLLQQDRIPYMVENDGKTILVPPEYVKQTLMQLAVKGAPGGQKPGMELFDKESFGTSSYVQRINYTRAMQGELTRTINTLKAVKSSSVHISMPPKSSFLERSEDPKASVVIELHTGASIVASEVKGIQNLVASSVEGLRPERVTIVDATGQGLTGASDPIGALSTTMLERQKAVEKSLESRVEAIVSRIVGQGNVVARVNADLDFDPVEEHETLYDPETAAVKSQDKSEGNMAATRPGNSEAAGIQGALPGPAPASAAPEESRSVSRSRDQSEYEVSQKVRRREKALGYVKRLSVAVLVNDIKRPASQGAGGAEQVAPVQVVDERTRETIAKLVRDAVGFVEGRDSVSIETAVFAEQDFDKANAYLEQQERKQLLYTAIRYGSIVLFAALFFFLVVRPFFRWMAGLNAAKVETILPKTVEELEDIQDEEKTIPGFRNLPLLNEDFDVEKAENNLLRDKLILMVNESPSKAAQIITDWMSSDVVVANNSRAKRKK